VHRGIAKRLSDYAARTAGMAMSRLRQSKRREEISAKGTTEHTETEKRLADCLVPATSNQ
jgi:hypothetical protein